MSRFLSFCLSVILPLVAFAGPQKATYAAGTGTFAPYVDVTQWPSFAMTQHAQTTGIRSYTLGFIVAKGYNDCRASWGTYYLLADNWFGDEVQNLRALGGDVIASFGGAANQELGEACTTVPDLKAQYQAVIDQYALNQIDFDIEGGILTNTTANTRRAQAIAQLQADAAAAGKSLKVSFTLPVLPQGLTQDGVNLVKNAVTNGVSISVLNIMAMDYGDSAAPNPANKMGEYAIDAATALYGQLKTLYQDSGANKSEAELWAMVGITPMIGENDVSTEIFNQQDAREVVAFAQSKAIGRIAMWSVNRDKACANGGSLYECTKITQSANEFGLIFNAFAGPSIPVTPTATLMPSTTPTQTPVVTAGPSPTPQPANGCAVTYKITNSWDTGFNTDVIIRNYTSAVINTWTLTWTFTGTQAITSLWNAKFDQAGATVSVKNESWNGQILINSSASFGFSATGSSAVPATFVLNGTRCNQGAPVISSNKVPIFLPLILSKL